MKEPIREIDGATIWYYEGEREQDLKVRSENVPVEIYEGWVRIGKGVQIPTWIPREMVEQIHER